MGNLKWDEWFEDHWYNQKKNKLIHKNRWDGHLWHPFQYACKDIIRLTGPKYEYYIVNSQGEYIGGDKTWIVMFGLLALNETRDFGDVLQGAWNHTLSKNKD